MPAVAHIGVGFAAKRMSPSVNVLFLIIAAELIEIIFMVLWAVGIEHPPIPEAPPFSPYSHSLIMGLLWSILAGMVTWVFSKNKRISWIIGLLPGRAVRYLPAPPQTRTSGFPAYGSSGYGFAA